MPTFMKASDLACRLLRKANILRGSIWFFRRHFNVNGKGCFSHPQARWIAPCELCSYAKKRRIGVSHFETFRMTSIALNKRYEVFQYVLEMFRKIVCILPILTFLTMKIPQSFLPWGGEHFGKQSGRYFLFRFTAKTMTTITTTSTAAPMQRERMRLPFVPFS